MNEVKIIQEHFSTLNCDCKYTQLIVTTHTSSVQSEMSKMINTPAQAHTPYLSKVHPWMCVQSS